MCSQVHLASLINQVDTIKTLSSPYSLRVFKYKNFPLQSEACVTSPHTKKRTVLPAALPSREPLPRRRNHTKMVGFMARKKTSAVDTNAHRDSAQFNEYFDNVDRMMAKIADGTIEDDVETKKKSTPNPLGLKVSGAMSFLKKKKSVGGPRGAVSPKLEQDQRAADYARAEVDSFLRTASYNAGKA